MLIAIEKVAMAYGFWIVKRANFTLVSSEKQTFILERQNITSRTGKGRMRKRGGMKT